MSEGFKEEKKTTVSPVGAGERRLRVGLVGGERERENERDREEGGEVETKSSAHHDALMRNDRHLLKSKNLSDIHIWNS